MTSYESDIVWLRERVKEILADNLELIARLHALEEKDRQRSTEVHNDAEIDRIVDEVIREDHDREMNLG